MKYVEIFHIDPQVFQKMLPQINGNFLMNLKIIPMSFLFEKTKPYSIEL